MKRRTQMVRVRLVREHTDYGFDLSRKTQQPCYTSMLRRLCHNRPDRRLAPSSRTVSPKAGRCWWPPGGRRKHLGAIRAGAPVVPETSVRPGLLTPLFLHLDCRSPSTTLCWRCSTYYRVFRGQRTKKRRRASGGLFATRGARTFQMERRPWTSPPSTPSYWPCPRE